jgi:hypothetical protein
MSLADLKESDVVVSATGRRRYAVVRVEDSLRDGRRRYYLRAGTTGPLLAQGYTVEDLAQYGYTREEF